jgi:hypothetical protein
VVASSMGVVASALFWRAGMGGRRQTCGACRVSSGGRTSKSARALTWRACSRYSISSCSRYLSPRTPPPHPPRVPTLMTWQVPPWDPTSSLSTGPHPDDVADRRPREGAAPRCPRGCGANRRAAHEPLLAALALALAHERSTVQSSQVALALAVEVAQNGKWVAHLDARLATRRCAGLAAAIGGRTAAATCCRPVDAPRAHAPVGAAPPGHRLSCNAADVARASARCARIRRALAVPVVH